jgi:hypothetical protein
VIALFGVFSLIGWLMLMQGYEQLRRRTRSSAGRRRRHRPGCRRPGRDGGEARWRPQVTYAYTVNGRMITATRITPGKAPNIKDEIQARDYAGIYLPQTPVTVHYNPAEITESVLQPATPRSAYLNLGLGAGLACLGPILFMLIGMPASRRRGWLLWRQTGSALQPDAP